VNRHQDASLGGRKHLDIVEPRVVDASATVGVEHQHVRKACAPDDLVKFEGVSGVDSLRERLVESYDRHDDLGCAIGERLTRLDEKRAAFDYLMDRGPRQREHRAAAAGKR